MPKPKSVPHPDPDPVVAWTPPKLCVEARGTTETWWRRTMLPELVKRGVVRRIGRRWFGRRGDILNALLHGPGVKVTP